MLALNAYSRAASGVHLRNGFKSKTLIQALGLSIFKRWHHNNVELCRCAHYCKYPDGDPAILCMRIDVGQKKQIEELQKRQADKADKVVLVASAIAHLPDVKA